MAQDRATVYWIPGCAHCIRVKAHLAARGVDFDAVNVHTDEAALAPLRTSGMLTMPVVGYRGRYVPGADLTAVDALLSLDGPAAVPRLALAQLATRTAHVLEVGARAAERLPAAHYEDATPCAIGAIGPEQLPDGTPITFPSGIPYEPHRTSIGLVRHLAGHGAKFALLLEDPAAAGFAERATFAPLGEPDPTTPAGEVLAQLDGAAARIERWAAERPSARAEELIATPAGVRRRHDVLADNTYSLIQHTRQLLDVLDAIGVAPAVRLKAADLDGFEVPAGIWS